MRDQNTKENKVQTDKLLLKQEKHLKKTKQLK